MMHDNMTHDHTHCCIKWVSWTAVFVGALVGLGLSFLLNLFNIAIGLSVFTTSADGMVTLAVGGFIGLLIGAIVSMFVAGYTAGYLGRPFCTQHNLGVLYGFTTWCLMLILTILLTSHIGRYVAAYSSALARPSTVIVMTDDNTPNTMTDVMKKDAVKTKPATPATSTSSAQPAVVTVDVETATNRLGMGAFVVFILFFIGALFSCIGGHCGAACRREGQIK